MLQSGGKKELGRGRNLKTGGESLREGSSSAKTETGRLDVSTTSEGGPMSDRSDNPMRAQERRGVTKEEQTGHL